MDALPMFGYQEKRCNDCGGNDFVEDHSAGDLVCTGCGLVVEAHLIDERSEWRTFSDKDKDTVDPNRVGGPSNPLLSDGGLSTVIGKVQGDGGSSFALNRLHARSNNPDRTLVSAIKQISLMCESLHLPSVVKDRACEVYKQVLDYNKIKGRGAATVHAACIFVACRLEGDQYTRSFKEVAAILTHQGGTKKDLGRVFKAILEMLKEKGVVLPEQGGEGTKMVNSAANRAGQVANYMRRWCNTLDMTMPATKACIQFATALMQEGQNGANRPWEGKSPLSVAAAIIYIVSLLAKDEKDRIPMTDLVRVTKVAEVTVKATYRDLYGAVGEYFPKSFAGEEETKKLPAPGGVQ